MYQPDTQRPSDLVKDELPDIEARAVPTEEEIEEAMKDVVDPELFVNIVDLGLLYGITVDDEGNVKAEYIADYVVVGDETTTNERKAAIDKARAYANLEPVA